MGRFTAVLGITVILLLFPVVTARTQPAIKSGPAVGGKIPEFRLPDHTGKQQDLRSIAGPKGAVIVFIRSADW